MATMTDTPTVEYGADVLDVRDLIERIEHLERIEQPGPVDMGDDNDTDQDSLFAELRMLRDFMGEIAGYGGDEQWRGDWYPTGLIRDSYFRDYAQELAEDIGAIDGMPNRWPLYHIDWDAAAAELRMDYTSAELDGVTYWMR